MSSLLHLPRSRRFNPRVPLAGLGDGAVCDDLDFSVPPTETTDATGGAGPDASDQPDAPQQSQIQGVNYVTFPRGIQNWENIDQDNYALLPAIGSTVTIISYVVPPGRNGIIYKAVSYTHLTLPTIYSG